MPPNTIYTTPICPYCIAAKKLLNEKELNYNEIDVSGNADFRAEMSKKAEGQTSVPQIWVGDIHIGGCDDLYALERNGKFDQLLKN